MKNKKVLVIGSGGREHALAWKIAQSPQVKKIFVAPGNAGIMRENKCENINIEINDLDKLLSFALTNKIDLTVVGPENPLCAGVVDLFQENNLAIFGPTKIAVQLEGSKSFAKDFFVKHNIPTAKYKTFTKIDEAEKYIQKQGVPIVIKADGLASGKGVLVARNLEEAIEFTKSCLLENKFKDAGHSVVIEDFLEGEEASFICLVDGKNILPLATSQDHKLSLDGDHGKNTGGMGAYSPAPIINKIVYRKIMEKIIKPTVQGLTTDTVPFVGFLYAGLMIDKNGTPSVVEYNVRLGDPETQPILMRLQNDFFELLEKTVQGKLDSMETKWDQRFALGVVMTAGGYPEKYETGFEISGLEDVLEMKNVKVFYAGTKIQNKKVLTAGGRVLCVTGLGETIKKAQKNTYEVVEKINWKDEHHRTDIGWRILKK